MKIASALLVVFFAVLLVGCGGDGGPSFTVDDPAATGAFAYVPDRATANVAGFELRTPNLLRTVPGSPFATASFPADAAAHPGGRFLYVLSDNIPAGVTSSCLNHNAVVVVYEVQTTGNLRELERQELLGSCGRQIEISPSGTVLYVLLEDSTVGETALATYPILADGTVGARIDGEDFSLASSASVRFELSRDTGFVYVQHVGGAGSSFTLLEARANGELDEVANIPLPFLARLVPVPSSDLVATLSGEIRQLVFYRVNTTTGVSTPVAGSQVVASAVDLDVSRSGDRIAVAAGIEGVRIYALDRASGLATFERALGLTTQASFERVEFDRAGVSVFALSAGDQLYNLTVNPPVGTNVTPQGVALGNEPRGLAVVQRP